MSLAKSSIMNLEEDKPDSDIESENDTSTVDEEIVSEEELDESDIDDDDEIDKDDEKEGADEDYDSQTDFKNKNDILELMENDEDMSSGEDLRELEDDDMEESLKKLEDYFVVQNLEKSHPEIMSINAEEIYALTKIVRDQNGNIVDPLHRTMPFLTKYEKARIIGSRAEQLDRGAMPLVELNEGEIHGRTIAIKEFEEKKIPFIIARPLPNDQVEYWNVSDLEVLI